MSVAAGSRSLVLITGASRGFGKSLALEAAKTFGPALDMHLIARNKEGLEATKQAVEALTADSKDQSPRIWMWPMDLGDLDALQPQLAHVFDAVRPLEGSPASSPYGKAYLFNNAGLVGPIAYAQDLHKDLLALRQSIDLNVTSYIYLTSLFVQHFGVASPPTKTPPLASSAVIVNVSSLAAIQPFHTWGVYCGGKAARDMFNVVVGQEQQQEGKTATATVKTLNYAPGPLDTDMQRELRESESIHPPTREWSMEAFKEGKLVAAGDSAAKCIDVLTKDSWKSGAHIDYYDDV
jgi:sepiapterin reductase